MTLMHLSDEKKSDVYNFFKKNIGSIINNPRDLNWILEYLNNDQRTEVYQSVKSEIPKLIKSGLDFKIITRRLTLVQREEVYNDLKERLIKLCQDSNDFWHALQNLGEVERKNQIKFLLDSQDFGLILKCIQPNHRLKLSAIGTIGFLSEVQQYIANDEFHENLMDDESRQLLRAWELYWKYKGEINSRNVPLLKSLHRLNFELNGKFNRTYVTGEDDRFPDIDYLVPPQGTRREMIKKILDSKDERLYRQGMLFTFEIDNSKVKK